MDISIAVTASMTRRATEIEVFSQNVLLMRGCGIKAKASKCANTSRLSYHAEERVRIVTDQILSGQRVRWYPSKGQKALARRCFDVSKMVYNQSLAQLESAYRSEQKLSVYDVSKRWTEFKRTGEYQDVPSSVAKNTMRHLDAAFKGFFASVKKGAKPAYPKQKGRFSPDQFSLAIDPRHLDKSEAWAAGRILLPGFGLCKTSGIRAGGQPKTVAVSRDALGRYWLSFCHERVLNELGAPSEGAGSMVGIDLGISTFATLSDGSKIENPRHLQRQLKALKRSQRALSRCMAKSNRRAKRKLVVAKLHAKVAASRADFLHKTSTGILKRFDLVAVEDLNVKGMMANKRLARHIGDLGLSEFVRQLEYKAKWYGRSVLKCGRWDPTSQICSACSDRGCKLSLSVRSWTCQKCGAVHDRDGNAARNVLSFALRNRVGVEGQEPRRVAGDPSKRELLVDHAEAHTTCAAA